MMDHGVLDLMMVGLQALMTENGKLLALVLESQARAEEVHREAPRAVGEALAVGSRASLVEGI